MRPTSYRINRVTSCENRAKRSSLRESQSQPRLHFVHN
jgi:hypothetical protein